MHDGTKLYRRLKAAATRPARVATVLSGVLFLNLSVATSQPVTAATDPFPHIGSLSLTDCNPTCAAGTPQASRTFAQLFVDVGRRQLIAYDRGETADARKPAVAFIDLDRFSQTGFVEISNVVWSGHTAATYDAVSRRLFLGLNTNHGCTSTFPAVTGCGDPPAILTVDLRGPDVGQRMATKSVLPTGASTNPGSTAEVFQAERVLGLAHDGERNRLYALFGTASNVPGHPKALALVAFDGTKLRNGTVTPLWTYRVRPCGDPLPPAQKHWTYVDVQHDGKAVYFMCKGSTVPTADVVVPHQGTLHGAVVVNLDEGTPSDPTVNFRTEVFPFAADLSNGTAWGDATNDRLAVGVQSGGAKRLYVFDVRHRAWTGSLLLGQGNVGGGAADPRTGRLYQLTVANSGAEPGLRISDAGALPAIIRTGIDLRVSGAIFDPGTTVDPVFDPLTRRLILEDPRPQKSELVAFEDRTTPFVPAEELDPDRNTTGIAEDDAETVTHSGTASAYGARAIFVGGVGGVPGVGIVNNGLQEDLKLKGGDRGLFFGRISTAQLSGDATAGTANASGFGLAMDEATRADLKGKYGSLTGPAGLADETDNSRSCTNSTTPGPECATFDALLNRVGQLHEASCKDFGNEDDVVSARKSGSSVSCKRLDKVRGWASGTAAGENDVGSLLPLRIGSADSRVEVVKDPHRGIITTSTARTQGIELSVSGAGTLTIGEVRSQASTVAHGRQGTTSSRFTWTVDDVRIEDVDGRLLFSCGYSSDSADANDDGDEDGEPTTDCDPAQVTAAISRHYAGRVAARSPRRDTRSEIVASDGGAQAIVEKNPYARWSDTLVNGDSQKELAGLELVVYNDGSEGSRVVVQFAAVFAESHYEIGQPMPRPSPAKLTIELTDDGRRPLAGGVFRVDSGDILDLDTAPGKTCVTTDDGVGDCVFDDLRAGSYMVTQTAAPSGYATGPPTPVMLLPGSHTRTSFTNLRAVGNIVLGLADEGGEDRPPGPLAGGTFELSADNGDLRLGDGDRTIGSCTTDAEGVCGFADVPLGAYVVHQGAAPDGYLLADDVGFELTEPGQTAALVFVVGLAPIEGTAGSSEATSPVDEARDTALVDTPTETASIEITTPAPTETRVRTAPFRPRRNAVERALAAPSEALSFLARRPRQALLFILMWVLLLSPAYLAVRRRTLILAKGVV